MEEKNKTELIKTGLDAIKQIEEEMKLENIVKDNKIEFKMGDEIYRVRKPDFIELQELDIQRRKKYTQLISDDSYLFREEWIKKYIKKGIDIESKEKKVKTFQYEIEVFLIKLAKTAEPKTIVELTKTIEKLRNEQFELSIEITDLLSYSIENQLMIFMVSYSTYLVLELKKQDKWVRFHKSYEEFEKSDNTPLISKAFYFVNYLKYNEDYNEPNSSKKTS